MPGNQIKLTLSRILWPQRLRMMKATKNIKRMQYGVAEYTSRVVAL